MVREQITQLLNSMPDTGWETANITSGRILSEILNLSPAEIAELDKGGVVRVQTKDQTWPTYKTIAGNDPTSFMLQAFASENGFVKVVPKGE